MDFALSEEQQAVVDLSRQILSDRCTQERLREVGATAHGIDHDLWAELVKADLVSLTLPTEVGGEGYGFLEACLLLVEQGRSVAPVPMLATLVMGAMPIAAFGTDEQKQRWLPGVIEGRTLLTAALSERASADPRTPGLRAERTDGGWVLSGVKTMVPVAQSADAIVVPATADDGKTVVFIVEREVDGLTIVAQDTFSNEPAFELTFDAVRVEVSAELGGPQADGQEQLDWIVDRATVALCAISSGVADAAMRLTSSYATERHQFDRPIGSFQAVGHRLADCFIDNEAIRLSMLYAASLLDDGQPASEAVSVAKYWASHGGRRIGHAALHIHGGISIDLDYPVHRYFLWAKQLENTLGAAGPQLSRLGDLLAG